MREPAGVNGLAGSGTYDWQNICVQFIIVHFFQLQKEGIHCCMRFDWFQSTK